MCILVRLVFTVKPRFPILKSKPLVITKNERSNEASGFAIKGGGDEEKTNLSHRTYEAPYLSFLVDISRRGYAQSQNSSAHGNSTKLR